MDLGIVEIRDERFVVFAKYNYHEWKQLLSMQENSY